MLRIALHVLGSRMVTDLKVWTSSVKSRDISPTVNFISLNKSGKLKKNKKNQIVTGLKVKINSKWFRHQQALFKKSSHCHEIEISRVDIFQDYPFCITSTLSFLKSIMITAVSSWIVPLLVLLGSLKSLRRLTLFYKDPPFKKAPCRTVKDWMKITILLTF